MISKAQAKLLNKHAAAHKGGNCTCPAYDILREAAAQIDQALMMAELRGVFRALTAVIAAADADTDASPPAKPN